MGGKALLTSLKAWAARHKTNTGDARSEMLSEKLAQDAQAQMIGRVSSLTNGRAGEDESLSLIAGLQLLLHCKVRSNSPYIPWC